MNAQLSRTTTPKLVTISLDAKGDPVLTPSTTVILVAAKLNEMLWKCAVQDRLIRIEINFPEDSPFRAKVFRCAKGASCLSGIARQAKARPEPYKYTVKVVKSDPKLRESATLVTAYLLVK